MAEAVVELDLTGLRCPGSLMELQKAMEHVSPGGVAAYLAAAERADTNLFI